jgi:hypothetical protein
MSSGLCRYSILSALLYVGAGVLALTLLPVGSPLRTAPEA